MVDTGLLEDQVHNPGTTLVMKRLQLLCDSVGTPYEVHQRPGVTDPVSLDASGEYFTRVKYLSSPRRLYRPAYRGTDCCSPFAQHILETLRVIQTLSDLVVTVLVILTH